MKECLECSKQFEPTGKRDKFCSSRCRQKNYRNKVNQKMKGFEELLEKFKMSEDDMKKQIMDITTKGVAISKVEKTKTGVQSKRIDPISEEGEMALDMLDEKEPKFSIPKNLEQLKSLCPKELTGFDRSDWIRNKRIEYGI